MKGTRTKRQVSIQLIGINKRYELYHEKPTLVEKFVKGRNETFWALKNINLTIWQGDRVGIIGPNGSGKTTLMKIISGISAQSEGQLITHGKVVTLIDLEAGFHSDLTGEQNIYLNGMILGIPKNQLKQDIQKIIHYAEVRQFIDAPLFTYSTGMKLRLGFSVAIHANPQILILDEGFLVGDKYFRNKIRQTLLTQFGPTKTIIVSTHSHEILSQQCNRILIMNDGSIVYDGGLEALRLYAKYIS